MSKNDTLVNDTILTAALKDLVDAAHLDRSYDIPYLAGYSFDRNIVYIDRRMPKSYKNRFGRVHDTDKFLILHECTEKAIIDIWKLDYQHAHQIALRAERAAVQAAGLDWKEYDAFMQKYIKADEHEKIKRVPADLDLTPYYDEKDAKLIKVMKGAMGNEQPQNKGS